MISSIAQFAVTQQSGRTPDVGGTEMERRHQGQAVVMHPAGIQLHGSSRRATAKKTTRPPRRTQRKALFPSRDLTGRLDHQVGPVAAVERGGLLRDIFMRATSITSSAPNSAAHRSRVVAAPGNHHPTHAGVS